MFIDTHAHLDFQNLKDNLDSILLRAEKNEVTKIIIPSLSLKSSIEITQLVTKYDILYCAVGIHPNELSDYCDSDLYEIENLANCEKVIAIGEIGLDYYWKPFDEIKQKSILVAQLEIARKKNLPVILHNREASEDLMDIISTKGLGLRGQFHAFSGDLQMAKRCIELEFMISFAGNITYKPNDATNIAHDVIKNTGIESLLLETDSPFLTPVPHRGKTNEPSYIKYIAGKIAELTDRTIAEVGRVTTNNAINLFGLT